MCIFRKFLSILLFCLPTLANAYDLNDMWVLAGVKGSADESWQGWCDDKLSDFTDLNLYNSCATFSPDLKPSDAFSDWLMTSASKVFHRGVTRMGLAPLVKSLEKNTSFNIEIHPAADDSALRFVLYY